MPQANKTDYSTVSPGVGQARKVTSSPVWMSPMGPGSSWQMAAGCLRAQKSDLGDSCSPEESRKEDGAGSAAPQF